MDGRPLRLALAIATLERGGTEKRLTELLARVDRERFAPRVVALTRGGGFQGTLEALGIPVTVLGKAGRWDLRVLPRLTRWLRRERIQILHSFMFTANFWGRLAARSAGTPVRVISGVGLDPWHRGRYAWADRRLAGGTDRFLAVSEAVREALIQRWGAPPERVTVIPNGKDPGDYPAVERAAARRAVALPESAWVIGALGRLSPEKGLDTLIAALPAIREQVAEARLLLVGEGPERDALERQARDLQVADRVTFAGFRDDVATVLQALDCLAVPSRNEGCPNAVLEAMAVGVPVIASDIPGMQEVILPKKTGLVFPSESPGALATMVVWLRRHRTLGRELTRTARARFLSLYTRDRMVAAYERVWQECAAARGLCPPPASPETAAEREA